MKEVYFALLSLKGLNEGGAGHVSLGVRDSGGRTKNLVIHPICIPFNGFIKSYLTF
jgi:hypothetical protein